MTDEASTTTWETLVEQYRERAARDDARIDELRQSTEHWHDTAQMLKRQRDMAEEERDGWKLRAMKAEQERQLLVQRAEAAEAERDDVIAICRGTQLDDAAIHSMRGYVTEKVRIEAERDALRKAVDAVRATRTEPQTRTGDNDDWVDGFQYGYGAALETVNDELAAAIAVQP